jgi:hypothetical protein
MPDSQEEDDNLRERNRMKSTIEGRIDGASSRLGSSRRVRLGHSPSPREHAVARVRSMTGDSLKRLIDGVYGGEWGMYLSEIIGQIGLDVVPGRVEELVENNEIYDFISPALEEYDPMVGLQLVRQIRLVKRMYAGGNGSPQREPLDCSLQ